MNHLMRPAFALLTLLLATPAMARPYDTRVAGVLKSTPLIDGHNDWAEVLRETYGEKWWAVASSIRGTLPATATITDLDKK